VTTSVLLDPAVTAICFIALPSSHFVHLYESNPFILVYIAYITHEIRELFFIRWQPFWGEYCTFLHLTADGHCELKIYSWFSLTEYFPYVHCKRSIQYEGLGTILGHELTHGFDNTGLSMHVYQCSKPTPFDHCLIGRQYDKEGRKRRWWSYKSIQNFETRQDCFVEQYSKYEMFGISVKIFTWLSTSMIYAFIFASVTF